MKQSKSPLEKSIDYGKQIMDELNRWNELQAGRQLIKDPFWPEGCNMNLCRNHILYYRGKIEEELPRQLYPAAYFLDVPPKYPNDYIANEDTIIASAKERLETIIHMEDYLELLGTGYSDSISASDDKSNHINFHVVAGYVKDFEDAIRKAEEDMEKKANLPSYNIRRKQSLMDVRRYLNYSDEWWQSAFQRCLKHIREASPDMPQNKNAGEAHIIASDNSKRPVKPMKEAPTGKNTAMPNTENRKPNYQFSFFDYCPAFCEC